VDLFDSILAAQGDSGNMQGLQYGIVAAVDDPLKLQRIQVFDQAKGGRHKSGWLMRGLPFTAFSPPVPKVNDLVIFGYILGDPHYGCYLGCVVNNNNKPVGSDSDLTITLGSAKISIEAATGNVSVTTKGDIVATTSDGSVTVKGKVITIEGESITLKAPSISFDGSTVQLKGKDVAVVGSTDSQGDTISNKGY
jgi:phage baseplate assembly protein gpV